MRLQLATLALALGFLLDRLIGDPPTWPHLVRGYGALIQFLENHLYGMQNKRRAGRILVIATLGVAVILPGLLLQLAWRVDPWVFACIETILCWQCLAARSLVVESGHVERALARRDLPGARQALAMIVGRDTASLDATAIRRATLETVAENTADGVVAPLFYLAIGGSILGCFYKAANTLDSMVGYRNPRYLDFGRAAARFDDILNYLPARLTALLLIVAAAPSSARAWRIWRRDRRHHASPNSAQSMAAMAGALAVQLGGPARYHGVWQERERIGDPLQTPDASSIRRAHRLLRITAVLMLALALLLRGMFLV